MINFFNELKKEYKLPALSEYNLVNITGKALYVEWHLGLMTLSKELISFRVKRGVIIVEGCGLSLKELSENTPLVLIPWFTIPSSSPGLAPVSKKSCLDSFIKASPPPK